MLKDRVPSNWGELALSDATQQMSLFLVRVKTKADPVSDMFCLEFGTVKAMKHADSVWEQGAEEEVWNWWERKQTES